MLFSSLIKKVDPSKAGTLEAAAKPEPPPPVQEEKKTATKPAFFSLFKPKVSTFHSSMYGLCKKYLKYMNCGGITKQKVTDYCEFEVLLDHVTTKVQAASTSGVRLLRRTTGVVNKTMC